MLTIVFLIFTVIFLLLIALEINLGKNYRAQKLEELFNVPSSGFSLESIPNYQFNYKAVDDYTDIVERPLFFKSREPIVIGDTEKELVEEGEALGSISIDLVGIINTPEGVFALFQDPNAQSHEEKFKRLAEGDKIDGWQLKEIQNDRVIISGSEDKVVHLSKPRAAPAPAKKRKSRRSNPFNKKTKK
jgi:hypothetical protein